MGHNHNDGSTSPTGGHSKRGILGRFRKHKEKETPYRLKETPGVNASVRSFNSPAARSENGKGQASPEFGQWSREGSVTGSDVNLVKGDPARANATTRQGTFTKLPFSRKGRGKATEEAEPHYEPNERHDRSPGAIFNLDTNLSNMEGILTKPPPLTPLDNSIFSGNVEDEAKIEAESAVGGQSWNAPDSWAVK